jgi:hypothetical protein
MSAFGCVVCGEPVQGLQDTCSEDCELVQDAATCPECHESTEPFAWDTGRSLAHAAHLAGCSRREPALRSAG